MYLLSMEEEDNKDLNIEPSSDIIPTYDSYVEQYRMINEINSENILSDNEQELNVLSLQQSLIKCAWNGNFSSPIHETLKTGGLKVLDVGCGSGTWLLDMCIDYPLCDFVGLDISPVFASTASNINNITFIQANVLDGLPFEDNTFDFVHQRLWMNTLSTKQWEPAIRELIRVCKVGGWLELLEADVVYYNEGINTRNLRASLLAFFYSKDFVIDICRRIPHFLKLSESFNDISEEEREVPLGDWAGEIGELGIKTIYEGYKAVYPKLKSIMGVNEEEFNEILSSFVKEANERKTYYKIFRYFCCKVR